SMRTRQNQTRQRNLEEARDLQRQAANLMESDALQAVFARTQAFAAQHPGDPDFQNIAAEVQQRTMLFPAQERPAAPAPPPPVPAEPKKKPAVAAPGMLARAWAAWHRMVPRRRPRIMAYCLVLLLAVAPVVVLKWLPPPAPRTQAPKPVLVNLRAQPAQARVTLDGKPLDLSRPLEVQPGASHILRAELEGFAPKELRIDAGTRDPVLLILDPLPTVLKVVTDLGSGSVVLDENKSALENGGFLASTVPAGMHKLAIDGGSLWQVKEISFESVSGAAPKLASELQRYPNLRSVVVTSFRNQARVYCNFLPAKAKVEDREYEVTKEGVDIAIQPGQPFDLTFTGDARPIHVDVPAGPALFAFLSAGEYGALEISVSPVVEDVQIFVDGKPLTRKPDRRGKVTIYNVAPGAHAVRVASADYTVSPESQPLQLEKRGLASAKFALTAKPKFASLVIRGGPPGAQVSVEGHSGVIDAAGGLQIASIRPGMQKIEISKADFETRSLAKDFAAGGVVELGVEETRLLRPAFNATFRVTPPEAESKARLNILEAVTAPSGAREFRQRASGHDPKQPLRLRDGTFKVEAVAEGFSPWSSETTFSVATTFPYHIEMTRPAAKPVPTPAQPTWRTVPAGHVESLGQGAGPFQIMVRPKKRELTWHIGHIDDGNYEEYRLDKDKLRWRKVVNTRPSRPKEKNLGFNLPDEFALQIVVRGTTVEQRLGIAGQGARVLPELRDKTPVPDNGQVRVYLEGQILKP
ncbi:MAG: hypothetical protein HY235_06590, partial [Acidobacteria bacterium]|nr:hypothetical protein [Acidobacteriota bacterium]